MKNVSSIKDCYGCGVCAIACPKHIISIKLNNYGFYEPTVSEKEARCIECNLCIEVCAFEKESASQADANFIVESYASWSQNEMIRQTCSSGGIGYELAKESICNSYSFCGVRYNEESQRAEHYIVQNEQDLELSKGSKYIPSYTIPGFSKLNKRDKYLVVGTPCQIDSLRHYIRKFKCEDNYVLVDFYCHGVPSMLLWKKYLKTFLPHGVKPTEISWRSKEYGWHDSWAITIKGDNYSFASRLSQGDLFYKYFLENKCLNKACYHHCKYKQTNSAADIRIGDLWGTKYKNNEAGVSAVLALSLKGKEWLQRLDTVINEPHPLSVIQEEQMITAPHYQGRERAINLLLLRYWGDLRKINIINCRLERLKYYKNRLVESVKSLKYKR